jgi:hypothetical protein
MYGSESWAMNWADRRMVGTAEMKFLRYAAGYTCKDQACNDNIRQRLGIFNLNDRIQQNKRNWHKYILHMNLRITKQNFTI